MTIRKQSKICPQCHKLIGKEKSHARNLGRNSVMCLHDEDEWKSTFLDEILIVACPDSQSSRWLCNMNMGAGMATLIHWPDKYPIILYSNYQDQKT